jgi:cation-transporting ATPase E
MANIERSANLFVTKTVYAVLLAITVSVISWPYPYLPRHLTIVSVFTIGVPGFFLALAPNTRRYIPGFIVRVLRFCIPAGLVAGSAALVAYGMARYAHDLPTREVRTTSALVLIAVALWVLVIQARPFTPMRTNGWKAILVAVMAGAVVLILVVPAFRDFYAVQLPPAEVLGEAAIVAGVAIALLEIGWRFSQVIGNRRNFDAVTDDDHADEERLARASSSS